MKAGAPGPPFKNLYVHPTAKSQLISLRFKGTAPALCAKSQIMVDPFS